MNKPKAVKSSLEGLDFFFYEAINVGTIFER